MRPGLGYFLFFTPALVLFLIFFVIPLGMGVYYSMTNWNGYSLTYQFVGLDNYVKILQDSRFMKATGFTLYYTVLVVVLRLAIALVLALLLNGNFAFRSLIRSVYFFPAVLSMITVGLIFNEIYYAVVPSIGKALGIEALSKNILGNAQTAIYGIVFTNVWQGVAVPMVIFLAGLTSVPKDLLEAATIDGASPMQRFFSVTLPFLIPVLMVNAVLAIKGGLTVFDYIVALTDGGPGRATESMGYLIYRQGMQENKFGYATAESIYVFGLILIISLIQIRLLSRKEAGQL
mgnify:CR=1 FL=1|jgi:raffinose/stachyose/melibiose transport system permease protein